MEGKKGKRDRLADAGRQAGALMAISRWEDPGTAVLCHSHRQLGSVRLHCTDWRGKDNTES